MKWLISRRRGGGGRGKEGGRIPGCPRSVYIPVPVIVFADINGWKVNSLRKKLKHNCYKKPPNKVCVQLTN